MGSGIPGTAVEIARQRTRRIRHGRPHVFTPTCVWCRRNLPAMKTLMKSAAGFRVVGVSLTADGLRDYVAHNDLPFPVYVASGNGSGIAQLKITGTPETIVVSAGGRVQKVWAGTYAGRTAAQIEAKFGVKLPAVVID